MRISFEIAGDKQLERRLLRVGDYAGDASPAFDAIASFMMSETQAQFDTEGRHASGGWKPLKPRTLAAKRRKGQDLRILHAEHALRRSLTARGDPNQVLDIQPLELRFGSKLVYAGAHQNPRPSNPLPRRRPIEFTEGARRRIVKTLQRYILTGEVGV